MVTFVRSPLLGLEQFTKPIRSLGKDCRVGRKNAKNYIHGYFTLETLDALAAGGRIPAAAAALAASLMLNQKLI